MTTEPVESIGNDSLDVLMPPPMHWLKRLLLGGAIVLAVGVVAGAWGFGHLRPSPECCGSGGSSGHMWLNPDGSDTVLASTVFYNSSSRALSVTGAAVDLPGAEVVEVRARPLDDPGRFSAGDALPQIAPTRDFLRLIIAFRPVDCEAVGSSWGSASVDLAVDEVWWPTIGRSYQLPDPVVEAGGYSVTHPDGSVTMPEDPLLAACELLGR